MRLSGIEIDYTPGDTYSGNAEPGDRADARQHLIDEFRRKAQQVCSGQMNEVMDHLLGLIVQFRAIEGSDQRLGRRLREMADFLEDL